MTDYKMDESYRRNDSGFSSMGVENKYYKDGYWYKQDVGGRRAEAESIKHQRLRAVLESQLKRYEMFFR